MENTTKHQCTPTMFAKQVGKLLGGLSPAEVLELTESTDIPHHKVNGQLRFDPDELKEWIGRKAVPVSGPPLSPKEFAAMNTGT